MVSQWIRGLSQGATASREDYERLVRESHERAYGLAYRLAGNRPDADDLLQETYLRAFRFWHRYDPSLPFLSWLYRIMFNVHVDTSRKNSRLRTLSFDGNDPRLPAFDPVDHAPNAEDALTAAELDVTLVEGLRSMNPEFRTAVVLADVEGMAYEEIAEVMRTSIGTVRSRIHRGRKQLRSFLSANATTEARL
jgi:RNA polymerase sigma-70 factor (ECF subfamily)